MALKDILAPILSVAQDEVVLAAAGTIAEAHDARITALLIEVEPDPVYTAEGDMVSGVWADVLARARAEFKAEKQRLDARVAKATRAIATRERGVTAGFIGRDVGLDARYGDLTVMLRPGDASQEDLRTRMFEGVLFGSGRPLLLVPPNWRGGIGRNVVVAWNGRREAARALADAAPFLARAQSITILAAASDGRTRDALSASAKDACEHLARRNVKAQARVVDERDLGEAAALFAEANALGADLLVMGGYGRSRLGEYIFGGVTREAVKSAPVPLFMSH
jgi:nucleotide-binding universal stress UspA family protein